MDSRAGRWLMTFTPGPSGTVQAGAREAKAAREGTAGPEAVKIMTAPREIKEKQAWRAAEDAQFTRF